MWKLGARIEGTVLGVVVEGVVPGLSRYTERRDNVTAQLNKS